ncbi:MAG: DUF3575 domain-containing protein [Bacteroidales bacterium]
MKYILKETTWILCLSSLIFMFSGNSVSAQNIDKSESSIIQVAVKTNLAVDAAMIPNIGVELALRQQWSVNANWYFAWWQNNSRHRFWHFYGGEIETRKWLGKKAHSHILQGHHLGLYFLGGTYDFEWGHKGYMSDFSYSVGLSYGYAFNIARNLSLDFVLGVGYLGGNYRQYKPEAGKYCVLKDKNLNYFGPTKAEISLVWNIGDLFKK